MGKLKELTGWEDTQTMKRRLDDVGESENKVIQQFEEGKLTRTCKFCNRHLGFPHVCEISKKEVKDDDTCNKFRLMLA